MKRPRGTLLMAFALVAGCKGRATEGEVTEERASPAKVSCVKVESGPLARSVTVRGRVLTRPGGDLPVASLVAGKLLEVKVEEGARVKQGTVIATVDDLGPRAAVGEARAGLARARSTKAEADAALARAKTLQAAGITSKADLDAALARADAAAADVAAQEAASGLASGTLGRVEVRSTFDGVVTKVWRGAGAVVDGTAGTPIVEIAADARLEFVADATEPELGLLAMENEASVELSSGPSVDGRVVALSRALDPKTGLGSVRIALEAKPSLPAVRIGAFGKAKVRASSLPDALSIPRAAMRGAVLDGADVAKCVDGKTALAHVTIGYRDESRVQVLSGLLSTDRVAVGDVLGLADGTPITEDSAAAAPSASGAPGVP